MARRALAVLVTLALLCPVASALEGPGGGGPGPGPGPGGGPGGGPRPPAPAPPGPPAPAGDAARPEGGAAAAAEAKINEEVDVKGSRYRVRLRNKSILVGVLPRGQLWERMDAAGDYEECAETDPGAGLRLQYVLGMEGDTFILRSNIAEVSDLGALTEEEKQAIRERVLADRRRLIEERARAVQADLDAIREMMERSEGGKGGGEAEGAGETAKALTDEERAGEELLTRFPPPDWGDKRRQEIEERRVITGVFPTEDEADFLRNFNAWKAAFARRERIEAEKKVKEAEEALKKLKEGDGGAKKAGTGESNQGG